MASLPVSLSCPHHIKPRTELPNPSPSFCTRTDKSPNPGKNCQADSVHSSKLSLLQQRGLPALFKRTFSQKPGGHPFSHSSGAETRPLSTICKKGDAASGIQHRGTAAVLHLSAIRTLSATEPVCDASTIFPGLSSNDVYQHRAIQGCSLLQWLTSSLGTLGAGSVKSNCWQAILCKSTRLNSFND